MSEKTTADYITELAEIGTRVMSLPEETRYISVEAEEAIEDWHKLQIQVMSNSQVIAPIDSAALMVGRDIYRNYVRCHQELDSSPYVYFSEKGAKLNPVVTAARQARVDMLDWLGKFAGYPMARHNKNMNLEDKGGTPSHGNKKTQKAAGLINGGS